VEVEIQDNQKCVEIDVEGLRRKLLCLLEYLGLAEAELSVVLVDDGRIRELNRQYRGKDVATDVLAFPLLEGGEVRLEGSGCMLLGDVVVSVETAVRQAQEADHSLAQEMDVLLVHGLLHLLGYDHETPEEAARMEKKTAELARVLEGL